VSASGAVRLALEEDIGTGDITTGLCVPEQRPARGIFLARQDLILAGTAVLSEIYKQRGGVDSLELHLQDGEPAHDGQSIATVLGRARTLLECERVALNFLQRLSGVATVARQYANAVAGTSCRVLDTRKTTPGLRDLEKRAAAAGGVPDDCPVSENGAAARAARVVAAVSASAPALVVIDDADYLEPGLAVTMIENLIDHPDSRVLVIAAVDLGSDLAAALTSRARYGPTAGRVHRAGADPRMGYQSRAELAGELRPHLTAAQAQQLARQTRTFAEIFAAARSEPLP